MSSGKKTTGSKITLGMLKGKPITTSVPTFTFRFNAEDEELEELYPSPEEPEELPDVPEEISRSRCSTPHTVSSSRDPSPLKEHFSKMTRRSSSLDESGSSDTWRLLHELKGKITKTVEEKISEMKSEKKKGDRPKLVNTSKESSISDSEECTGVDKIDESPSHRSTVPSTPETTTPEPEPIVMDIKISDASTPEETNVTSSPCKTFFKNAESTLRNRIRPKLSELRHRKKKTGMLESSVSMSALQDEVNEDFEVIDEEEVESALEVQEETTTTDPVSPCPTQPTHKWTFVGHLTQLCRQRVVQALLVWPVICMVLSLPSSLRYLVLGALLMHALHTVYQWFIQPGPAALEPISIPDFKTLSILQVPAAREYQPLQKYEGWMNELSDDYDPEIYHINQTRSVYLRLEGSCLRICLTRQKVRKRAMWNEPPPRLSFYHQRIFDIAGCAIKLLPDGLARKRLWSKKYPICVELKKHSRVGISVPDTFKDVIEDEGEGEDVRGEEENSEDDTFYLVTSSMVEQNQLFLFARTDREKDDWVRRLVAATKVERSPEPEDPETPSVEVTPEVTPLSDEAPPLEAEAELHRHLSRFLQQQPPEQNTSRHSSAPGSPVKGQLEPEDEEKVETPPPPADTAWFNALLSRVLFDVVRDPQWSEWVRDRIQRKLSTIKLPTFMEELTVSALDLGTTLPVVHRTSSPHMDERGLWVDLDVSYEGSANICVETKLNLVKLTKGDSMESSSSSNRDAPSMLATEETHNLSRSPMFDSDLEDSAESSSDDDTQEASADDSSAPAPSGGSMGKMLFRMATKITTSRYFQQASEIRYIRRAMEEMSNTKVMVQVELKGLLGVVAINIPPPPSDRFWYGFRGNPELRVAAKAKLGERLVTLSQVTDWIENKLCIEFQKVFVLPNMDELIIPVMNGKVPK